MEGYRNEDLEGWLEYDKQQGLYDPWMAHGLLCKLVYDMHRAGDSQPVEWEDFVPWRKVKAKTQETHGDFLRRYAAASKAIAARKPKRNKEKDGQSKQAD